MNDGKYEYGDYLVSKQSSSEPFQNHNINLPDLIISTRVSILSMCFLAATNPCRISILK